jgi:hypothetical protein
VPSKTCNFRQLDAQFIKFSPVWRNFATNLCTAGRRIASGYSTAVLLKLDCIVTPATLHSPSSSPCITFIYTWSTTTSCLITLQLKIVQYLDLPYIANNTGTFGHTFVPQRAFYTTKIAFYKTSALLSPSINPSIG